MTTTLEVLLVAIRDGTVDGSTLARARALVASDERIPADVREIVLLDPAEAESDAVALLSLLGIDDLGAQLWDAIQAESGPAEVVPDEPLMELSDDDGWAEIADCLREGILAEAGDIEIASAVLRRLPLVDFAWGPVLADANQAEAGAVELADAVLSAVAPPTSTSVPGAVPGAVPWGVTGAVARAVIAEAGEVDVADAVMATLGIRTVSVRDAVIAAAGPVDLVDAVMDSVLATAAVRAAQDSVRAAAPPVALAAVIPAAPALGEAEIPTPANQPTGWFQSRRVRRYGWMAAAMAAMVLFSVFVGRMFLTPTDESDDNLLFAQAGDVVIEDLSSGDDVSVTQLEGDDGAVILWIDEEAG